MFAATSLGLLGRAGASPASTRTTAQTSTPAGRLFTAVDDNRDVTRIAAAATAASAASIMVAAAAAGPAPESRGGTSQKPEPLRAGSLERETGLRLLVADNPPVVLEVDSGRVSRVAAIPATRRGGHAVVGVAGRAGIVVAGYRDAQLYAVRNRGAHIARLGTGSNVTPARNGEAVWVQSFVDPLHCKLRRVRLDGRVTRVRRAFPCASR